MVVQPGGKQVTPAPLFRAPVKGRDPRRRRGLRPGLLRRNRHPRAQRQHPPRGFLSAGSIVADNNGDGPRRRYIKRRTAQARAYSQAVVTEGGKIVWLAGQ